MLSFFRRTLIDNLIIILGSNMDCPSFFPSPIKGSYVPETAEREREGEGERDREERDRERKRKKR